VSRAGPTALIAEDEPLLRDALERLLARCWPELSVVARARNGREAVEQFERFRPDVCFLDVHMPGMNGVEAGRHIGGRAHLVFVTAHEQYAVEAFAQGVIDYLVKPVELPRLADTVDRLKARIGQAQPPDDTAEMLQRIATRLDRQPNALPLRWIRASVGQSVYLIPVAAIDFLRTEEKYTSVAWRDEANQPREAIIRTPLKELIAQLDEAQFSQVHRSVVVNLQSISRILRGPNETAAIHLKGRSEVLPVSRSYLHLFRQM
jgi:DNA-binding LytR/AlgR family response regulator